MPRSGLLRRQPRQTVVRSWSETYELMELVDGRRFYPNNRDVAAAFREEPE